ncbi:MAG: D-alanyl-D-alanine carboxypeptidase, partial [Clostridiales Family XIII bacterium]|nr:D-alanyl-D-alanine carboxypeptidase [Clostridiales Family XIII bacterium]
QPGQKLTLSEQVLEPKGSSIMLLPEERVSVKDLLYAALLESGNDAAVALAEGVDGSVEAFAERMNARARELGAKNTNFVNPHGLHEEEHYTSAYDLALIAREAMKHKDFRKAVTTYEYKMKKTNLQPERLLHNSNRLLYSQGWHVMVYGDRRVIKYEEATGIKTGYTSDARNTLIAGAERDGVSLIAVLLKSEGVQAYQDAISLFEYGFHNFEERSFVVRGEPLPLTETVFAEVDGGQAATVAALAASDIVSTYRKGKEDGVGGISVETSMSALTAPVEEGQVIGAAFVYVGEGGSRRVLGETDLVAAVAVEKKKTVFETVKLPTIIPLILKIGGVVLGIAVLWVVIVVVRSEKQRRNRRMRRMNMYRGDSVTREVKRIRRIK